MSGFFFNEYPYTDFHELNLSWLLKKMIELNETVKNFVSLNTIKYADPIQWNIASQYEKNTVVVDPQTGTAYLSVAPVPSGVALSNPDYWTVIFDLDIAQANNNITLRDDGNNVLSTFTSDEGDWLLWNGTLYRVTQAIGLSQAYVPGYNIERYTVELFVKNYITALQTIIGSLDDLDTTDQSSIVNAINELKGRIDSVHDITYVNVKDFGAVGDGVTDDTSAIDSAIAEAGDYGVVWFPQGTYLTSGHALTTATGFEGVGPQSTIICTDNTKPVFSYGAIDLKLLQIKNLWIGRQTPATASETNAHGIYFPSGATGQALVFENVLMKDHYISFNLLGLIAGATMRDCWSLASANAGYVFAAGWYVYNCFSYNCGESGFKVTSQYRDIGGFYMTGCTAYRTQFAGYGFLNDGASHIYDVMCSGCMAVANRGGGFVFNGAGSNHTLNGCYSEFAGYDTESKTNLLHTVNASSIFIGGMSNIVIDNFLEFESGNSGLGMLNASRVLVSNCSMLGNEVGISGNHCTDVSVKNCNLDGLNISLAGIVFDNSQGANDSVIFDGINVKQNTTPINFTSAVGLTFKNIIGWRPTITTPTLTSGQTYTNDNVCDVQIIITGDPTGLVVDGVGISAPTSGTSFVLKQGRTCYITFTNPTYWTWLEV